MRGLPLLILLGVSTSALAATVYKWVDSDGVVHYSDQPNPNAEKLQIPDAQTYAGSKAAAPGPAAAATPAARPANPVTCSIDTPGAGAAFLDTFSITGHVTVAHAPVGAETVLRLDGMDISGLMGGDGSFEITQIDRGEHQLSLQVITDHGDVTCQAGTVTFSVRQRAGGAANAGPTAPGAPGAPTAPMAPGVR